jgi:sugar lactone lactonase YvrE
MKFLIFIIFGIVFTQLSPFTPCTPSFEITGVIDTPEPSNVVAVSYYEGILGSEETLHKGNYFYVGELDGNVYKVNKNSKVKELFLTPQNFGAVVPPPVVCGASPLYETYCGRVLGMKLDSNGDMLIVNAYFGIFRYKFATMQIETIIGRPVPQMPYPFFNDVDEDSQGNIYWTETSQKYFRAVFVMLGAELCDEGVLKKKDAITGEVTTVKSGFTFVNGLVIDDDDYLYVSESFQRKIFKINLNSPTYEETVLIKDLPLLPDNLEIDGGVLRITGLLYSAPLFKLVVEARAATISLVEDHGLLSQTQVFASVVGGLLDTTYGIALEIDKDDGTVYRKIEDPYGFTFGATSSIHKDGEFYYTTSVFSDKVTKFKII